MSALNRGEGASMGALAHPGAARQKAQGAWSAPIRGRLDGKDRLSTGKQRQNIPGSVLQRREGASKRTRGTLYQGIENKAPRRVRAAKEANQGNCGISMDGRLDRLSSNGGAGAMPKVCIALPKPPEGGGKDWKWRGGRLDRHRQLT
jgi:hypothetical protein